MRTDLLFAWPTPAGHRSARRRTDLPAHLFRMLMARVRRRDLARGTLRRNPLVTSARTRGGGRPQAA
jgi:hypothetical protein